MTRFTPDPIPAPIVAAAELIIQRLDKHHLARALRTLLDDTEGIGRAKADAVEEVTREYFRELMLVLGGRYKDAYYDDASARETLEPCERGHECLTIIMAVLGDTAADDHVAVVSDSGRAAS